MLKIEKFPNSNLLGVTDTVLEVTAYLPGSTSYLDAQKKLLELYKYRRGTRADLMHLADGDEVREDIKKVRTAPRHSGDGENGLAACARAFGDNYGRYVDWCAGWTNSNGIKLHGETFEKLVPASEEEYRAYLPEVHYCYQCDHETAWLAPDGRCGACTSYSPEEIRGEV